MIKGKDAKPHIGIFGRRNYGKSSIINVLAGQEVSIVSEVAGTTTDPVKKSIEIPGIGPVIIIDTAGIDDSGELGLKRVAKSKEILKIIDFAILVITCNVFGNEEISLISEFNDFDIPYFIIHNKSDLETINNSTLNLIKEQSQVKVFNFSAQKPENKEDIIKHLKQNIPASAYQNKSLIGDLLQYGDIVMLIVPIDIEAPEGRLILPQIQAIRDILDNDCVAIILKEREVDAFLKNTKLKPKLAITDSQIFLKADASVPKDIPLTGFSIMLARHKGDFYNYLKGTPKIAELKNGDRILLLESCTHHVSCDDIGRVKIPRWITNFTGKQLDYDVVAGLDNLPRKITDYALVIQCGGCMITQKQIASRLKAAVDAGVPVTNYGMTIAFVQGIYNRAIEPFTKHNSNSEDYL